MVLSVVDITDEIQVHIFTDHVRRTREGNVLTRLCDSVHRG